VELSSVQSPLASASARTLFAANGAEVAKRHFEIACGGSLLLRVNETFSADERLEAGDHGYAVVRDLSCRLFGYHGLLGPSAFSLDHMFGF